MAGTTQALPYYAAHELRVSLAGAPARLITKPGFLGWEEVGPTVELLLEAAEAPEGARAAVLGCGSGALGVGLARRLQRARVVLADQSAVALAMAARSLTASGARGVSVSDAPSLLPEYAGQMDLVLLDLPQSRALARRWLVEAFGLLRSGGRLLLAGPNELGIQPAIADAGHLFGEALLLDYRRRCRVARATRFPSAPVAPMWAHEPGVAPGTWHELSAELAGHRRSLASLPGVFSYERLDDGTALLLRHAPDPAGLRVLDAGCGYGPLGLAAGLRGAARVDMVDSSVLAAAAARENLARLGVAGEALAGDALEPVAARRYDLILSNLPFHSGKRVSYDAAEVFLRHGRQLLAPGGAFAMVTNGFVRHDRLLAELFASAETLADDGRYRVVLARA